MTKEELMAAYKDLAAQVQSLRDEVFDLTRKYDEATGGMYSKQKKKGFDVADDFATAVKEMLLLNRDSSAVGDGDVYHAKHLYWLITNFMDFPDNFIAKYPFYKEEATRNDAIGKMTKMLNKAGVKMIRAQTYLPASYTTSGKPSRQNHTLFMFRNDHKYEGMTKGKLAEMALNNFDNAVKANMKQPEEQPQLDNEVSFL